jgi:hypothetical protein
MLIVRLDELRHVSAWTTGQSAPCRIGDAGFRPKSGFHQNFFSNESAFRQALTVRANQDRGLGKPA